MTQIDPNIALGTTPAPVALQSPLQIAQQGMTLQELVARNQLTQGQLQLQKQGVQDQQTLSSLYKQHTNPDGSLDAPGIVRGLGDAGSGHLIPGFQSQQQALAKSQADVASTTSGTANTNYDLAMKKLNASSAALGALLNDPDVTSDKVAHSLVYQVQQGMLDQDHAENTFQSIPKPTGNAVADKQALRTWLQQNNLRIDDAKDRLEQLNPKRVATTDGKTTQYQDFNPVTNPAGPQGFTMQTTPGEDQTAATTRRGQDMVFRSANTVVQPTPTGYVVVNKDQPATSVPVTSNGVQVMQPASPTYKNEQTFASMQTAAQQARDILTRGQPTASGFGAMRDSSQQFFGIGSQAQSDAASLEALGGALTASVPRMEGPQSDADRKAYEAQAGKVGDKTLPTSVRIAALDTVLKLQKQYAKFNGGNGTVPPGMVSNQQGPIPPPGQASDAPAGGRPPLSAFER